MNHADARGVPAEPDLEAIRARLTNYLNAAVWADPQSRVGNLLGDAATDIAALLSALSAARARADQAEHRLEEHYRAVRALAATAAPDPDQKRLSPPSGATWTCGHCGYETVSGPAMAEHYERCPVLHPKALEQELQVTEALLAERQKLLDAIPECPAHGACVPHALEWIEAAKRAQV